MEKTELQLNIEDVGEMAYREIARAFDSEYENVKTNTEYAPYGDTYACVGEYIDEDDDTRIREDFVQTYDFDEVMDLLKKDPDFKRSIVEMVEYIAFNRE